VDVRWRLVVELLPALDLARHSGLELGNAVDRRIFGGLAVADRLDGGLFDVIRRVEVRLASTKPDHIAASRFKRTRFVRDGDGRRRLDAHDLVREKSHCDSPLNAVRLVKPRDGASKRKSPPVAHICGIFWFPALPAQHWLAVALLAELKAPSEPTAHSCSTCAANCHSSCNFKVP